MKEPLSLSDRDALRVRIVRGELDRGDLKALNLHPHDEDALEQFMPAPPPATTAPDAVPNEIERIARDIGRLMRGSELLDPVNYLLKGNWESISALLTEDEARTVARYRDTN